MRPDPVSTSVAASVLLVVAVVVGLLGLAGSEPAPADPSERSGQTGRSGPDEQPDPLVIETPSGAVRGVAEGDVHTWRGLPYAAPPVADLRWRTPQPVPAWDDVRDATSFAPACLQPATYEYGDEDLTARRGSSEDCLYLNVTRPVADAAESDPGDGGLPVIVWLHGGGLIQGSGSFVDPTALAERGAVVVTVNYRLGRLGFFAHPAIDQDVANLGLTDQIASLQWVRDTIGDFGGDPDVVTVMGASAGAISVNALMAAPSAAGLFDNAIAQSATGDSAARTLADVRREAARDFPDLTADELRALPASALFSSTFNVLRGDAPILDSILPESAQEAFAAGREAPVPYLVGTTDAEFSDADYRASGSLPHRLRAELGGAGHQALVAAYGARAFRTYVLDDLVFHAPALSLALEHSRRAPTFRYRFQPDRLGSVHGAEVPYVFGTEDRASRRRLVEAMGDYWVAFARTGSPQVAGLPSWPRAAGTSYLELGTSGPRPVARDPWTSRLAALYAAVPLRLPAGPVVTGARGR